ncbi:MAG TPA: DUF255 domain-containing protein, partial [Rhodanobacteraceae bacterium]|nr:DUF255 domain-containing protein [Rhodanobacteraceae bacterium]
MTARGVGLKSFGAWASALLLGCVASVAAHAEPAAGHGDARIAWLRDDTAAFARAKDEHRFVLLYLEAVWCHWCHVMDEKT